MFQNALPRVVLAAELALDFWLGRILVALLNGGGRVDFTKLLENCEEVSVLNFRNKMGEVWDDDDYSSTVVAQPTPVDFGRSFGRGRGFLPATSSFDDSENNNFGSKSNFLSRNDNDEYEDRSSGQDGRRGGRGGGNRGGRGGGGSNFNGGGYRSQFQNDDDEGDDGNSRGRRRNEGFRNNDDRPRGRRQDDDDDDKPRGRRNDRDTDGGERPRGRKPEGGDGDEKPRELYIPPEPTEDEEEIFTGGISSGINFNKYDNIQVKVSGENGPGAIDRFETSGLRPYIIENIQKSGYTRPTPIQKHAIPIIMEGRDLMGCAQTGSGKTAAFLLPIINVLLSDPRDLILTSEHCEPHAVIVSPTRELTLQIFNEARKFAHGSIVKTVVAYGGTAAYHQAKNVMKGCHILVATPGRLLDFVNRGRISFASIRFVVLDEADRMLDMGFMPDIERMMNHPTMVPTGERQTLMFSATFPDEIQRLAGKFLSNYLFVAVGIVGGACTDVDQKFYQVTRFEKRPKLVELLNQEGGHKTLVFVEMKRTADFIAAYLSEQNFPTTSIHGDRMQREREEALADFKTGKMPILVATAVAARGLDIKNVAHVVNYDLPKSVDEYVHRIGRTGRVGNRGKATSFYDPEADSPIARDLVKILSQAEQPVPDWLEQEAGGGGFSRSGRSGFGGKDFRKFGQESGAGDFGGGQPQVLEEEEVW